MNSSFVNAHEPIVDGKTFAYTKEQLRLRSKGNYRGEKKYSTDYSGFMFCEDCGSPIFSMSRPDLATAYTCGTYHKRGLKGCTSHHIRVDVLDGLLKAFILRVRDNCGDMIAELQKMIDEQPEREEQLVAAAPILANGDMTGAVCMVQPETGAVPSEGDIKLAQVAAAFLGKQLEE